MIQDYWFLLLLAAGIAALFIKGKKKKNPPPPGRHVAPNSRLNEAIAIINKNPELGGILSKYHILLTPQLMSGKRIVMGKAYGSTMELNEEFVNEGPIDQVVGLILHELAHLHMGYGGDMEGELNARKWAGERLKELGL